MNATAAAHWIPQILEACPAGILVQDRGGLVLWANPTMAEFADCPLDTLIGMRPETAPSRHLEALLGNDDVIALPSGEGGAERVLACRQHQLPSPAGVLSVHFYTDVTETCRLRTTVAALSTYDELCGVHNRRGCMRELDSEISRSRRYDNPLSAVYLSIHVSQTEDRHATDDLLRTTSRFLRAHVRWTDSVGRIGSAISC